MSPYAIFSIPGKLTSDALNKQHNVSCADCTRNMCVCRNVISTYFYQNTHAWYCVVKCAKILLLNTSHMETQHLLMNSIKQTRFVGHTFCWACHFVILHKSRNLSNESKWNKQWFNNSQSRIAKQMPNEGFGTFIILVWHIYQI